MHSALTSESVQSQSDLDFNFSVRYFYITLTWKEIRAKMWYASFSQPYPWRSLFPFLWRLWLLIAVVHQLCVKIFNTPMLWLLSRNSSEANIHVSWKIWAFYSPSQLRTQWKYKTNIEALFLWLTQQKFTLTGKWTCLSFSHFTKSVLNPHNCHQSMKAIIWVNYKANGHIMKTLNLMNPFQ